MCRANSLILGTKKEDLLEGQFAYPGDKEKGPAGESVRLRGELIRLSWGQKRRRTCCRASSLILETKKEDLPESQFACVESQLAYLGNKEGGPAKRPIRLSWEQRRRTWRRASSLVWICEDLLEGQFAYPGDKEGKPAGEPVRLCGDRANRLS